MPSTLKRLLQGRPLGHPIHAMLVHLPIGLLLLSFLLDIGSFIAARGNALVTAAFATMIFGIVGALLAAVPGFIDYTDIRADHPAKPIATRHMVLNLIAVGLYVANIIWRGFHLEAERVPIGPFVLSLIAIAILSYSGYLGGVLIYDDGVAVGRHRHPGDMPAITLRADAPQGEFVTLTRDSEIAEKQTIRAQINGVVMVLTRLDGQLFAFQEFCTHRYGPLSEGCFVDGKVMCPWHRSQFDVRSGKVAEGPARQDIRTFEVSVRDGQVMVKAPEPPAGA